MSQLSVYIEIILFHESTCLIADESNFPAEYQICYENSNRVS